VAKGITLVGIYDHIDFGEGHGSKIDEKDGTERRRDGETERPEATCVLAEQKET
jgi:hypothetical protein